MNSYERVITSLGFHEPDRVPLDIGGTTVSGIALSILDKLLTHYDYPNKIEIPDHIQQVGIPSSSFLDFLGIDTRRIGPTRIGKFDNKVISTSNQWQIMDIWKIEYVMEKNGHYFDQVSFPLGQESRLKEALAKYKFPSPDKNKVIKAIQAKCHLNKSYFPVLDRDCAGLLEMAIRLRGFEKFMIDLILDTKHAEELLDRILEYKLAYWEIALNSFNRETLVVAEADDYGTESSLIISVDLLKKIFFPRLRKIFNFIKKKNKKAKIFFHCDGSIRSIIPDLVKIGVDILNPVQFTTKDMKLENLKRDFGKDIVFWGAGIDTQNTLPFGSPEQVEDEGKRNLEIMAPGGGFIFSAVHNIQADVPLENLLTLLNTFHKNCYY